MIRIIDERVECQGTESTAKDRDRHRSRQAGNERDRPPHVKDDKYIPYGNPNEHLQRMEEDCICSPQPLIYSHRDERSDKKVPHRTLNSYKFDVGTKLPRRTAHYLLYDRTPRLTIYYFTRMKSLCSQEHALETWPTRLRSSVFTRRGSFTTRRHVSHGGDVYR